MRFAEEPLRDELEAPDLAVEPRFPDEALPADERLPEADLALPEDALLSLELRLADEPRPAAAPLAPDELRRRDDALLVVPLALEGLRRPEVVRPSDWDPEDAARFLRSASSRVAAASARLPAALTAVFAVPPADLAASATRLAVFLADPLTCASLRFAAERLRVAAALVAEACRCAFVCLAIRRLLFLASTRTRPCFAGYARPGTEARGQR